MLFVTASPSFSMQLSFLSVIKLKVILVFDTRFAFSCLSYLESMHKMRMGRDMGGGGGHSPSYFIHTANFRNRSSAPRRDKTAEKISYK